MFWRKKKKEAIAGAGITEGLEKTRKGIFGKIGDLIKGASKLDDDLLEELEEILISSDVGVKTSMAIVEELRENALKEKNFEPEAITSLIKKQIEEILLKPRQDIEQITGKPHVVLVVGVNGTGKTTTIGKLAHLLVQDDKKVVLAAADTFRAAAIEQLKHWAERIDCPVVAGRHGGDAAAVAFDATKSAIAKNVDYLIIDTAGRQHTRADLMEELPKILRTIRKNMRHGSDGGRSKYGGLRTPRHETTAGSKIEETA